MNVKTNLKLQQLRHLCAVVDHGFNVSKAALALHTSQPAVSRQIQWLEKELGAKLLERNNTRIAGLTAVGRGLFPAMRRMLVEADNLHRHAQDLVTSGKTRLVIGTTHTYARHTLLPVLKRFIQRHPRVALQLRESAAPRIMHLLLAGEEDVGVAAEPIDRLPGLAFVPCYPVHNSLLMPPGHPLLKHRRITLERMLPYPIITYDERHYLGRAVRERFKREGLEPNIVMSIIDDDVMKAYVEAGFGIAILPSVAYSRSKDRRLRAVSVNHLFEPDMCVVMTQEGRQIEPHIKDFIELVKATPVAGIASARR